MAFITLPAELLARHRETVPCDACNGTGDSGILDHHPDCPGGGDVCARLCPVPVPCPMPVPCLDCWGSGEVRRRE